MTLSFPYSLAQLADLLVIKQCVWDIQRNDELDGTGDGRVWQSELAPPLWMATVTVESRELNDSKQVAALLRKLSGAAQSFYLYDPSSKYPQADPAGAVLGTNTVEVSSIGSDGTSLSLKGLPANYALTLGDKLHIDFGSNPTRRYFAEIDETLSANGSGVTAEFQVFPAIPAGISTNAVVALAKPAAKMFISPGSFSPGTMETVIVSGLTFKAMQRVR